MSKFVSLPLKDGSIFVVNTNVIISIIEKDGFGALILNQIPFRAPCDSGLLAIIETQPIVTCLRLDALKSLLGVIEP